MALVVAISGATCTGKTTIAKSMAKIFGSFSNIQVKHINQDTFYWPDESANHVKVPGTDWVNWEVASSVDNSSIITEIEGFAQSGAQASTDPNAEGTTPREVLDHVKGLNTKTIDQLASDLHSFCAGKVLENSVGRIVFLEGILLFNHRGIYDRSDLRFFINLTEETCRQRRSLRHYDPPDPPAYFDRVVWPHYVSNLEEIQDKPGIAYLSGEDSLETNALKIVSRILQEVCSSTKQLS